MRQAKSILNSDEGMNMLKERMEGIESKNQDGTTRLSDIYTSFDEIESKNDDQLNKLRSMKVILENFFWNVLSRKIFMIFLECHRKL